MSRVISLFVVVVFATSCKVDKLVPYTVIAQTEICNGVDDDLDGWVDEDSSVPCSSDCGDGVRTCINGKLTECSTKKPPDGGICPGQDPHCIGKTPEEVEIEPCYPKERDLGELHFGVCRFGVYRCIDNSYVCVNSIIPSDEVCNGEDDNCNNMIDEGVSKDLDIVVALDLSYSMNHPYPYLDWLIKVINKWAEDCKRRTNIRIALVTLASKGGTLSGNLPDYVHLVQDLQPPDRFIPVMASQSVGFGSLEATIDSVYYVSTSQDPLRLHWSDGANKVILVFTNEPPQSWVVPQKTEQEALALATLNGVAVYVFTDDDSLPSWSAWNAQTFTDSPNVISPDAPDGSKLKKALDALTTANACK